MGDLKMPFVPSKGVDTLTHLPDRPWLNKLLRVINMTPFGRERGVEKTEGSIRGKGESFCAPRSRAGRKVPGGIGGGSGNVPRPDRK